MKLTRLQIIAISYLLSDYGNRGRWERKPYDIFEIFEKANQIFEKDTTQFLLWCEYVRGQLTILGMLPADADEQVRLRNGQIEAVLLPAAKAVPVKAPPAVKPANQPFVAPTKQAIPSPVKQVARPDRYEDDDDDRYRR
jgi:hypothetical protein